jgi:hypothetical protein
MLQNTNYVLRVARGRRDPAEPTGEAESVRDRVGELRMGDRVTRHVPAELLSKSR